MASLLKLFQVRRHSHEVAARDLTFWARRTRRTASQPRGLPRTTSPMSDFVKQRHQKVSFHSSHFPLIVDQVMECVSTHHSSWNGPFMCWWYCWDDRRKRPVAIRAGIPALSYLYSLSKRRKIKFNLLLWMFNKYNFSTRLAFFSDHHLNSRANGLELKWIYLQSKWSSGRTFRHE